MTSREALRTVFLLSLFASLGGFPYADTHQPETFRLANYFSLSRLRPQWLPNLMNGISVWKMLELVHELQGTICDEVEGLCVLEGNVDATPDVGADEDVTLPNQDSQREVRRVGLSCGRGVVEDGRCVCPLDYFGYSCERVRDFHCEFVRVVPAECDFDDSVVYNPKLDGDPPCVSYSRKKGGNISLGYKLKCALNPLHNPPERNTSNQSFSYVLRQTSTDEEDEFSLSELPDDEILFRPFNWDRPFSDLQFSQTQRVTKEMLLGTEAVIFSVPMEKILNTSPGFSRGGRFFAEVRLLGNGDSKISRATDCWPCVARAFVEIMP